MGGGVGALRWRVRGVTRWINGGIVGFFLVMARLQITPAFNARAPTWAFGKTNPKLHTEQKRPVRVLVVANPQLRFRAVAVAVAARAGAAAANFAGDPGLNQLLA